MPKKMVIECRCSPCWGFDEGRGDVQADTSASRWRMMDFNSNVHRDVGDGVAAKVSRAGLRMLWGKPLATNRPSMMCRVGPVLLLMANLVSMIFWSTSGLSSDQLMAPKWSLLCKDASSLEMASLMAVLLYWLMSSSYG